MPAAMGTFFATFFLSVSVFANAPNLPCQQRDWNFIDRAVRTGLILEGSDFKTEIQSLMREPKLPICRKQTGSFGLLAPGHRAFEYELSSAARRYIIAVNVNFDGTQFRLAIKKY